MKKMIVMAIIVIGVAFWLTRGWKDSSIADGFFHANSVPTPTPPPMAGSFFHGNGAPPEPTPTPIQLAGSFFHGNGQSDPTPTPTP